ncbi:MAG: SRPBCC domain-containing protein [Thermoleophilia bacterium]|nr:SRPBCC domain-containing protein [Thermoleophilia bacterium]
MARNGTAVVTLPGEKQILVVREFDAPRHLVYRAYTTPELIKRWWAGRRGETTVAEMMEQGMQEALDLLGQVAASLEREPS